MESKIAEKLLTKYKSLPDNTKSKLKYGVNWALNMLESEEELTCKNCKFCFRPIYQDEYDEDAAYCVFLENDCKLYESCSWMEACSGSK